MKVLLIIVFNAKINLNVKNVKMERYCKVIIINVCQIVIKIHMVKQKNYNIYIIK